MKYCTHAINHFSCLVATLLGFKLKQNFHAFFMCKFPGQIDDFWIKTEVVNGIGSVVIMQLRSIVLFVMFGALLNEHQDISNFHYNQTGLSQ